ncbi:MAG: glycosyltransferase [Sphingobacteriales bacterium]|nr:glycosyltransferase [Sphingobacteriales bacterium]
MWLTVSYIIIAVYGFALLMIFFYSTAQLHLLFNYVKSKKRRNNSPAFNLSKEDEVPYVTIQLPVYNEKYVMERLLHCIAAIDYPKNKLEIQVLDDSTDDSVTETAGIIRQLQKSGLDIQHIKRTNRINYKAGALKEGLETAKGEFIAIFDADFLPQPEWIKQTVIYFKNSEIGVVQTRWGHINRDYSLLTKVQAFALDTHFTLEQTGRNANGYFMNFNGTAGIWRKQCIIDAGNWEGDTLTEDLDLSYRAQLNGWKFKYLEDVVTPAELPVVISAARSQQFRWNKGGAENFIKMFRRIISSKRMSFKMKLHGLFHLVNSSMFFFVLIVSVLSIPMLYVKNHYGHLALFFNINSFFIISTAILFICNWVVYKNLHGKGFGIFIRYIRMFFSFFTVALGFSLHNSLAVAEAYAGKKSEFIRTPKFNINKLTDSWKGNQYLNTKISINAILETLLLLYFGFGLYSAFIVNDFAMIPFHIMLFAGYGYVVINSFRTKK